MSIFTGNTGLVHIVDFDQWRERVSMARDNITKRQNEELSKITEAVLKRYHKKPLFGEQKTDIPDAATLKSMMTEEERWSYHLVGGDDIFKTLNIIQSVLNTEGTGLIFLSGAQVDFLQRWAGF